MLAAPVSNAKVTDNNILIVRYEVIKVSLELIKWIYFSIFSGEVSYRIGEKGAVKVLFSSDERAADERTDREVSISFLKSDYF